MEMSVLETREAVPFRDRINPKLNSFMLFYADSTLSSRVKGYGGHAATLLVYFRFWGARAEDRTQGCLTAA